MPTTHIFSQFAMSSSDDLQTLSRAKRQRLLLLSEQWAKYELDRTFPDDDASSSESGPQDPSDPLAYKFDFGQHPRTVIRRYRYIKSELQYPQPTFMPMRDFLIQNRLVITDNSSEAKSREITHVSFNGGNFSITDPDLLIQFYRLYAQLLAQGYTMFFVERPDKDRCAMRFMLDLDFKHVYRVTARHVEMVMTVVQRVVQSWFPHRTPEDLVCLVNGAPYLEIPPKSSEDPQIIKAGVHIIWKNLYVSLRQAITLRYNIMLELETVFGKREPPANSWNNVVDRTIYDHSGLRMIMSHKTKDCPRCYSVLRREKELKKEQRQAQGFLPGNPSLHQQGQQQPPANFDCPLCHGGGKVDDGRRYMLMFCMRGDGKRDLDLENTFVGSQEALYRLVVNTVVRTSIPLADVADERIGMVRPATGVVPPELADADEDDSSTAAAAAAASSSSKRKKRARSSTTTARSEHEYSQDHEVVESHDQWKGMDEVTSGEIPFEVFESAIHAFNPEHYGTLLVFSVRRSRTSNVYFVRVKGHGCKYCNNVQTEHHSNTVYFDIRPEGVRQRCFKRDDNSSASIYRMPCRNFQTKPFPISEEARRLLFPEDPSSSTASDLLLASRVVISDDPTAMQGQILASSARIAMSATPESVGGDEDDDGLSSDPALAKKERARLVRERRKQRQESRKHEDLALKSTFVAATVGSNPSKVKSMLSTLETIDELDRRLGFKPLTKVLSQSVQHVVLEKQRIRQNAVAPIPLGGVGDASVVGSKAVASSIQLGFDFSTASSASGSAPVDSAGATLHEQLDMTKAFLTRVSSTEGMPVTVSAVNRALSKVANSVLAMSSESRARLAKLSDTDFWETVFRDPPPVLESRPKAPKLSDA